MTTTRALDASNLTGVSIGIIVALVVIGLLIGLLITKLVVRVVVAVVVVVLAVVVWQQRGHVRDEVRSGVCRSGTFFGVHVDPPQKVCPGKTG